MELKKSFITYNVVSWKDLFSVNVMKALRIHRCVICPPVWSSDRECQTSGKFSREQIIQSPPYQVVWKLKDAPFAQNLMVGAPIKQNVGTLHSNQPELRVWTDLASA